MPKVFDQFGDYSQTVPDGEIALQYEDDATQEPGELPLYINDGIEDAIKLSPEDQARLDELDRSGLRNGVLALGGLALEGASLLMRYKGYEDVSVEVANASAFGLLISSLVNLRHLRKRSRQIHEPYKKPSEF